MANVAKLEKTMTDILDHPKDWDQRSWICGSTACYAGRAALNEGLKVMVGHDTTWAMEPHVSFNPYAEDEYQKIYHVLGNKAHRVPVGDKACEILDISGADALLLFNQRCTMDNLQEMVKDLANGESLTGNWRAVYSEGQMIGWERIVK